MTKLGIAIVGVLLLVAATPQGQEASSGQFWARWRGPLNTGVSPTANPPLAWSESENIRWKVEIPGRGVASPVVWNDRVFVTTAVPADVTGDAQHDPRGGEASRGVHRFVVMAIGRETGRTIWQRIAHEQEPHEPGHPTNSTWASSSPVTDGERLYAYFESFGLYAYDMDGTLIWDKDFGDKGMRNEFGEGSTPALFGNTLVIVWDHLHGDSSVVAVDARNGEELWRVPRDEIDTWATPIILDVNGRPQVIVPAMERVRSYDLENGSIVWESDGLTMNAIPSPVYENGLVFLMSGFRGNDLKAIRVADARGNIDGTDAIVWTSDRDTPYVPSPLLIDGILYFLKTNSGILSAVDAATGAPHYQNQRLAGVSNVFSSPVAAEGRVYITGRDGTTVVIRSGAKFEVLGTNTLEDSFDASPALVDNDIYLRGYQHLYAISEQ
jgi:outer membrane protein assembly factor BamB